MSKLKLVVIGNGMVGHRYIEDLVEKADMSNIDITVFCEEPRVAYDRVHLSSYFSHHTADELSLVKEGFYEKHGINMLIGERAININRENRIVYSSTGREVQYDKLILATGSFHLFHLSKVTKAKTVLFTVLSKILKRSKRVRRRANQALLSVVVC